MSESSDSDEPSQPKRKRGITNPDTYKRNIIREARIKGKGYVTYKGKKIDSKVCPQDITCKCPTKCHSQIDQEVVEDTWNYFYSLESKNCQDTYLQSLIEVREVGRRTKPVKNDVPETVDNQLEDEDESSETVHKRNHTFVYYLKKKGCLVPVCKNVFMKVHGVTSFRIRRIYNLLLQNKSPRDLRGKKRSGNAIPGNVCILIHQHISSYDVKETHYGGKPKKYLDARLTVKKMYEMFLDKHPDLSNVVKYNFYYTYFKENFDYRFGRPQVDVCCTCESLSSKLKDPLLCESAKRTAVGEMMVHKNRAKKYYKAIKDASNDKDDETLAICFDFMQNLPLPHIPVQEVFYMRQLWVNCFCIHNLKTKKAKFYVYHEGVGNKSPDEVCSFLYDYIKTEVPDTIKKLVLFSDGPFGQNKNHTMIRFLMALCDNSHFESIEYCFPVRGHSFCPCDRDFGCIKRLIRKADRIYTPQEYIELILKASNSGRFTVHEVKTQEILNFKSWWPPYYKKSVSASDETAGRAVPKKDKESFKISTYRHFMFSSHSPGKVVVREFINGLRQSTFTLLKCDKPPELPTTVAYPNGQVRHIIFFTHKILLITNKRKQ